MGRALKGTINAAQVRGQLDVLRSASGELMACSDFMILLRAVLTLGNHLNEGTMRGSASGAGTCHFACMSPSAVRVLKCNRQGTDRLWPRIQARHAEAIDEAGALTS